MGRRLQLAACWLLVAAVVASSLGRAAPAARGQAATRSASHAWTLDEALAHLALHPRDAYVQYVALQLARRAGRYEQVAAQLRAASPALARVTTDDLFSVFTGALAVQESLQLDTMRPGSDGVAEREGGDIPVIQPSAEPPVPGPTAQPRRAAATRSTRTRQTTTRQPTTRRTTRRREGSLIKDAVPDIVPAETSPLLGQTTAGGGVPVSSLQGPTVKSHPWEKMLAGRKPEVSPLSLNVPEDFYFAEFRTLTKLVEVIDAGDLWGTHLFSQAYREARTADTGERLKRQLAIQTDPASRPFYDLVVGEVGVTGSDPFAREGSDVTLLFRVKQPLIFKSRMDKFLDDAQAAHTGARRETGQHLGVDYVHLTTPERGLHVFAADPSPDLHVRSNSLAALKRVLEAVKGKTAGGRAARRLGDTNEFAYVRTLLPRGHADEDGLIYLSDAFVRRLVGPELKLTEYRRVLCYNHLRMIGHAALLFHTERGRWPENLEELAQTETAPGKFGAGPLACPDGGRYSLSADATAGVCTRHGHAHRLTPNIEVPVTEVSAAEASRYRTFVENYNQYWRTFFDPIALRVKITPQQYKVETIILPLIDNSIYTTLASALGGPPEELDALPVPRRNMFTAAFRLNKESLLKSTGLERDVRDEVFRFLDVPVDRETRARLRELLTRGVGNQLAFHLYDAHPTFDLNTASALGLFLGAAAGGRGGGGFSFIGFEPALALALASLNTPVYVSVPVKDAVAVDRFLEHLDRLLAVESRRLRRNDWFGLELDFYKFTLAGGQPARGYGIRFGPAKFRLFWARVGDGLYLSSKPFVLEDLAALPSASPSSTDAPPPSSANEAKAHAMARVRASSWNEVLPDYRLSWAEHEREACLNNLGALSGVARADAARAPAVTDATAATTETAAANRPAVPRDQSVLALAGRLHAVHFFCPEGGAYRVAHDGKSVSCDVHGTAAAPRQPAAPTARSAAGRLMPTLSDATATLTFTAEGLHAAVVVNRK